jgi:hypothetical protein
LEEENMRRRISFCLIVWASMCPLLLRVVTDSRGAAATVTVKNRPTGAPREAITESGGAHWFPPLLPGVYAITISHRRGSGVGPGSPVVVTSEPASDFEGDLL